MCYVLFGFLKKFGKLSCSQFRIFIFYAVISLSVNEIIILQTKLPVTAESQALTVTRSGFPLSWKTPGKLLEFCKPGKLLEFYVRPGIFGTISRFTRIKAKYSAYIFTTYFLQQVLTLIAFNYVW